MRDDVGREEEGRRGGGVDVIVDARDPRRRHHRGKFGNSSSSSSSSSSTDTAAFVAVRVRILNGIPIDRREGKGRDGWCHGDDDDDDIVIEGGGMNGTRNGSASVRGRGGLGGDGSGRWSRRRRWRRRYVNDEHATAYYHVNGPVGPFVSNRLAIPSSSSAPSSSSRSRDVVTCRLFRDLSIEYDVDHRRDDDDDLGSTTVIDVDEYDGGCNRDRDRRFRNRLLYSSSSTTTTTTLWAPVVLRGIPHAAARPTGHGEEDEGDDTPTLYVPPCLAATLGIRRVIHRDVINDDAYSSCMHVSSTSTGIVAYLSPLSTGDIVKATHATLREIGRPVPVPSPIISPGFRRREDDHVDADEGVGRLRNFFLYPPSSRGKRRFRRDRVDNDDDIEDIIRSTMMRPNDGDCYYDERRSHNRRRKYKPRQRLLALGTIFSVPTFDDRDYDLDDCVRADGVEVVVEEEDDASMMIRDVRFYQVVDASHCERSAEDDDAIIGERRPITTEGGRRMAYIISPSTRLVLLPPLTAIDDDFTLHPQLMGVLPMMRGYELRLPHPMLTISFLRSVAKELLADDDGMTDATRKTPEISKVAETTTTNYGIRRHHPSANDIVDALYLQGAIPADHYSSFAGQRIVSRDGTHPRIIHVIGKEENNVRACIDEACDIMGMRSFHVDGLGAFWAHYNLFNTYRQRPTTSNVPPSSSPLTGALPDKIRGLSASLDIARQSSPCVLHVAGIDLELSSTEGHSADPDARAEEERRVLEVIRAVSSDSPNVVIRNDTRNINVAPASVGDADRRGRIDCDMSLSHLTTPRVIVILSTSTRLPPGPLASSLLQRSIAISHPDANYARILWDNDIDGTFDSLSSYLIGMSAREIGYLRQKFAPRWQEGTMKSEIIDCPATAIKDHLCKPHTPVEVLQSLLPDLEITRSFTQSSRKGGGSNTLPLSSASLPNVRWEDIGGLESVRKEIMDAVELPLKYPTLFEGSRRSGILLFGPPGTGKTLVAKAVARECGLPFLSVKGPELLGSYVGESEANIRAVFDAARLAAANPPTSPLKGMPVSGGGTGGYIGASVLFFDEFDSLAPRRGETGHGDGVMDRVVATLLGELDGSGGNSKGKGLPSAHVVVIAATNRPDLLDPSLLRPGRLDRLLYLGPAKTREHCLKILLAQTRKFSFDEGSDAATVLERAMESFPPTLSGADLSAVASGALMRGIKRVCNKIEDEARSLNSERGVGEGSDMAVDIDDVMNSWSKDKLQPVMTAEDFVEAAKDIVPSISSEDLRRFETLQKQFSSWQYE